MRFSRPWATVALAAGLLSASGAELVQAQARPVPIRPAGPQGEVPPGANTDTTPQIPPFETGIDFKPTSPNARVTFNLEDAELPDLVRLISSITGKAFIIPNKTRSIKATVYAPNKVSASEAYRAFLSILELNGLALVPSGRYLKIVESQGVENKTIPLLINENVPPEDRFVTHLYRVNYVSSEDVASLLGRFKSAEGNITAYAPTNTLIITDTGNNIRRMLRIVEAVDIERGGEQLWIEPVHHANASDLASRLTEIFPLDTGAGSKSSSSSARPAAPASTRRGSTANQPAAAPAPAATASDTVGSRTAGFRVSNILADERTNSLILMATETAYLRILELIRHLDVPLDGDGGIHVHYLQHGDAEEISKTLTTLVGAAAKRPASGTGSAASRTGAPSGSDAVFEGSVAITAHKPTNSLVITSSLHDFASLKRVIDRLDTVRRQVFIEAVVITLDVNNSRDLGLNYFSGVPDFPKEGSLGVLGYGVQNAMALQSGLGGISSQINSAGGSEALSGIAIGIQGPVIEGGPAGVSVPSFGVALAALAQTSDSDVLATPHLLALNNEEAEINIGQNVPLQGNSPGALGGGLAGLAGLAGMAGGQAGTQSAAAGLGAMGGMSGFAGVTPRGDVGTRIRITPHINESDEIRLKLEEEISDVGAAVPGNAIAFPINRRTAKTHLVVRDQQTVVIGGLMRDQVNRSQKKIPLLGDIPLLGAMFRRTTTTKAKSNLLLFLTPYIVRSQADLRAIYERKMRERQEFLDRYFVFGAHNYHPAIDYSRTRGLVAEIFKHMAMVEEDRRLSEEMALKPAPDHRARPPIGTMVTPSSNPEDGDTVIEGGGGEPPEPGPERGAPEPGPERGAPEPSPEPQPPMEQ